MGDPSRSFSHSPAFLCPPAVSAKARPDLVFAILCLLVLGTYSGVLDGDFIWDDRDCIIASSLIKAADGLRRIWFTHEPIDYWPVSYSLYWSEWRLWGMETTGYHLVNICLHIATCFVVWRVLKKLSMKTATVAALIFAVHPVSVEAVAWIVQSKTLLATLFGFLSLDVYLGAREKGSVGLYFTALVLFLLSLLSKHSLLFLPVFLALYEGRDLGPIWPPKSPEKIPKKILDKVLRLGGFFLASWSLGLVGLSWYSYDNLPAAESISQLSTAQRLASLGTRWWTYVGTALWPRDVMFIYPSWDTDPSQWPVWLPTLSLVGLTVLAIFVLLRRLQSPSRGHSEPPRLGVRMGCAWVLALSCLLPVLGLVDIYFLRYAPIADHWQYAALPALLILCLEPAWALIEKAVTKANLTLIYRRSAQILVIILTAGAIGTLAHTSYRSAKRFTDEETLWQTTIRSNPKAWLAYNNLATIYAARRQNQESEALYRQALALKPDYPNALQGLAMLRLHSGREAEALGLLREARKFNPQSSPLESAICGVLARMQRLSEAVGHCESALRLDFRNSFASSNLITIYLMSGRMAEAEAVAEQAVKAVPYDAERLYDLGRVLLRSGNLPRAQEVFAKALTFDPRSAIVQEGLGELWIKQGDPSRAIPHLVQAVRDSPQTIHGRQLLVEARLKAGDLDGARRDLEEALGRFPHELSLRQLKDRMTTGTLP